MGIASRGLDLRGQRDIVGFASTAEQMARVWDLSAGDPAPALPGSPPAGAFVGAICPHDDYAYAGRIYRAIVPLVTARTVVLIGVFHGYLRLGFRDILVFDPYRAWRSPDGEIRVSALREDWLHRLTPGVATTDQAAHDSEHSLEAVAYWLRHRCPDLEIVPVLVPAMSFERIREVAAHAGSALAEALEARSLRLGRNVAVVISSDAVHYGADFRHAPFGESGPAAVAAAVARDRALLAGHLSGPITEAKARALYETFVDPDRPDEYRLTWCGRFSIPAGMMLLHHLGKAAGSGDILGIPIAYGTSIGAPALPLQGLGMGVTAPASTGHFVGHAAVGFATGGSAA